MSETKLLPCPFCGKPATRWMDDMGGSDIYHKAHGCRECFVVTYGDDVTEWNTRPREAELEARLSEYEGEDKRWYSFETVQAMVKEREELQAEIEKLKAEIDKLKADKERLEQQLQIGRTIIQLGTDIMTDDQIDTWKNQIQRHIRR